MAALAAASACLALLLPAPAARANTRMISLVFDDNMTTYGSDDQRVQTFRELKAIGVDGIRVTVSWEVLTNGVRKSAVKSGRFDPTNPSSYPHANWDRYDNLVRDASQFGLLVLFNVTGPGPDWTHPPSKDPIYPKSWRPNPVQFQKFMVAVGKRYSGTYRDENADRSIIPPVRAWSMWNEPNQPLTLTPQSQYSRLVKHYIPVAPILYRQLYIAGGYALVATGHSKDYIMPGETAPLGKSQDGLHFQLRPARFIREMFCLNGQLHPYSGKERRARACDDKSYGVKVLGGLPISAWAHHPYTQKHPPWEKDPNPSSINMANVPALGRLLDRIAARTHDFARGLPIWLTEIGWQTNPPDPVFGVSIAHQAEYMNVADHMAYDDPRVAAQTQFLVRDVGPQTQYPRNSRLYWYTWQSGLFYENHNAARLYAAPKPSLNAFVMPLDVRVSGSNPAGGKTVNIWGQLRFLPNGSQSKVYLQFRPQGSTGNSWTTVGDPIDVTDPLGYYFVRKAEPVPGVWRAIWVSPTGRGALASREALVSF